MRIAVIGLGVIGSVHAGVLADREEEIAVLCDIDRTRAETARTKFAPAAAVYTDWREMLDAARPDAVHICTPHYLHAEMVVECLRRNIHVLCEKPLCMKTEEIDAVLAAERASAARLGVCHQNRFLPVNRFVKEYLSDKEIAAAHGTVVWHRDAAYYRSAPWRGTQKMEGGGVLINQALHTLDLLAWFCGDPAGVTARGDNFSLRGVIEVEDTLSAVFDGKAPFTFFATNASAAGLPVEIRMTFRDGGGLTVFPDAAIVDGTYTPFPNAPSVPGAKACYGSGHAALIDEFYRCIGSGERFPIDGAEASRVIKLILAAYKSHGERVPL